MAKVIRFSLHCLLLKLQPFCISGLWSH